MVDVGGGVGAQTLLLADHHPQLRFVVQDRETVLGDAVEVCALIKSLTNICSEKYILATVLEEEHARRTGIRPRENPRFIFFLYFILPRPGLADNFWVLERTKLL